MGSAGDGRQGNGTGQGGNHDRPGDPPPEPADAGSDDIIERLLGGPLPEYSEYVSEQAARAGELAIALRQRNALVAQLETELWQIRQANRGLEDEIRRVGPTIAALQQQIAALAGAAGLRAIGPEPATSPDDVAALYDALADLEARLQEAVGLVLDEMNGRRAAEARVRQLEAVLRAHGLSLPPEPD